MKQKKISGVYKITNNITNECYIGSSKDIKLRWASHKSPSKWKQHPNSKLYKDMTEFGLGNFIFEVLEETDNLKEREQYWIEHLKPVYNNRYAKGWDTDRYKETTRRCCKEWNKTNQDKHLAMNKAYYSRVCFYENETLTLGALSRRLFKQGIPHPTLEAKKYLMTERD